MYAQRYATAASKEVESYAEALRYGFNTIKKNRLLTNNVIIDIYKRIKHNEAGFRSVPGTKLTNDKTGEVVYEPPQNIQDIKMHMHNLEAYINKDSICDVDPLVKMAIIHHQFESIHPFSDGNGRTGRIINILYLVKQELLDLPVLYLSRYIIKNKGEYYRLLQAVRDDKAWEEWILFMLKGVEETSIETISLVEKIVILMMEYKKELREKAPKIYSQDLLNNLFRHPYTKIDFVCKELNVTRPTATLRLNRLVDIGLLNKIKMGRDNFYLNKRLFGLLMDAFYIPTDEDLEGINSSD